MSTSSTPTPRGPAGPPPGPDLRPRVQVTRHMHFSAAHRLFRPDWSDEENDRVFGDCANPQWHGHNYEIEVTVDGEIDPETGYVMDLKLLKDAIQGEVIDDVDHRNLNEQVSWLAGVNPTTENLVVAIWNRLAPALPDSVELRRIVLRETPRNHVEYTGPRAGQGDAP
ncbi:MAG: 6-carboxytetrahydropterin synthase [Gemmatimonadales bacterium]|nr:MAG: 6-carboxytetrahydropterin synthase [Gemmatimonadales bacterium]